ncbi:colorectal cancer-associated protein 2 [Egretta garzetta]|uniref:colorectal cancer-associated protein 2 n=1 Tax=Egretta garzetta TaxID=188379 RepID=UPI00051F0714|nr:colorectal cancer-associated protein 2 [Egretta garzetta]
MLRLVRFFPQILSGKPKVYQGVRVKITVKELLQQRRARQAATGAAVRFLQQIDLSAPASSIPQNTRLSIFTEAPPFDAEPISSVPNYCPSWQFSNCLSCEESPSSLEQLVDSCLQTDVPLDPAFSAFQTSSHYTSDAFQPVPLCFNQGLHVDNRVPQYFPCPSMDCMDYLPPMAMADDFFRRDRNCDICYS